MAISTLANTKWVFNDEITISSDVTYGLNFTSNNTSYTSLRLKRYYDSDFDEYMPNIYYNNDNVYGAESTGGAAASNWNNQAYKTIEITGGTDVTNVSLIAWLEANAVQQQTTPTIDFDLSTLQLSAGTHEIKVKARATGFKDSNFSNSVNYVVASGFNLIAGQDGFNTGYNEFLGSGNVLEYSLDDGSTWQTFNKNFAANETILTGITQIKFRISNAPMTHGADYYNISSTKLNLDMAINGSDTVTTITSNNFVLTQDIDDLYGVSFVD